MTTIIDRTPDAPVAETPANGHQPTLAADPFSAAVADSPDSPPAKIEPVAERTPRRGIRKRLADRRARHALKRDAALAESLDESDWTRWFPALIWACVGVVAVTFVLSYHGLFEYGKLIAYQPEPLPTIVPLGVDALSLVALLATFLTRDAHWKVRAYCWLLFGFTVAVSIAGNAVYAISEVDRRAREAGLDPHAQTWDYHQYGAVAGSALWPAFSAAALHLLIIARRHLVDQRAKSRAAVAGHVQEDLTDQLNRARAIELIAEGATCGAIADELGVPRRTVERWTAGIRNLLSARPATPPAKTTTRTK